MVTRTRAPKRAVPVMLFALALVVGVGVAASPSAGARTSARKTADAAGNNPASSVQSPLYCFANSCSAGTGYSPRVGASPKLSGPPTPETFTLSTLAATPGSQVSLHWGSTAGQYFTLASPSPTALPDFDSGTAVIWPNSPGASWSATSQSWTTTGDEVTVAIPSDATAGQTFGLQLVTCDTEGLCSNSAGGGGAAPVSLVVVTNWTAESYRHDYPKVSVMPQAAGVPLDVTFGAAQTIWDSSEFSDALGQSPKKSTLTQFVDPTDVADLPFAACFSTPCVASGSSALGERVIYADKLVWFTQGGWLGFPGEPSATIRRWSPSIRRRRASAPTSYRATTTR